VFFLERLPQIGAAKFIVLGSRIVSFGQQLRYFFGQLYYLFWTANLFFWAALGLKKEVNKTLGFYIFRKEIQSLI
jgi:hypothetical protein